MRSVRRLPGLPALLVCAAISLFSPLQPTHGQTATPTPEQIDIFRNLTPDQQQAILNQLGGAGGAGDLLGGSAGGLNGLATGSTPEREARELQRQQAQDRLSQKPPLDTEELERLDPELKGGDWVVIEADFHLSPRPLPTSVQVLAATQGLGTGQLQALQGAAAGGAGAQGVGASLANANTSPPAPTPEVPLSGPERDRLQGLIEQIRKRNPYQLSREGALLLPGFAPIPLLGLTDDSATLRLKTEPAFEKLDIRLTRLPLKKTGFEGLRLFGYDLFDRSRSLSTFAPITAVPVPADYVVGPGDEILVQLYGSQNRNLRLRVGADGIINFPELGPISVVGQLFTSVQQSIESRVQRQMIGVRASVSMGETRALSVFVVGDVKRPGTYTVSGLSTITSALFAAGGIKQIGSMRNVLLRRHGALVRRLDLYDLLIHGDTTDDSKLLTGDTVFIPPLGRTVSVAGEVRRPAIYETRNESTVADAVDLAGGLSSEADLSKVTLTRIDPSQGRIVLRVDLTSRTGRQQALRDGDSLEIPRLRPTLDSGILVQGHLFNPGPVAYRSGMRLTDAIRSVDELKPDADIHYVLIRRETPPDRRISVLSADLAAAVAAPGSAADVLLAPRDRITVFDFSSSRERVIAPLLDELRLQSSQSQPTQAVHVDGLVKVPGQYPLEPAMRVSDLVRAGGGLADAAYGSKAELTRYTVVNGDVRQTQLLDVDLAAALRGDPAANVQLAPFDVLSVKEVSGWEKQESVTLKGEVRFPGRYSIRRGETLRSVLKRAGGLTEFAFPEAAVFTRTELRQREQDQLDMLSERMQRDLAILAVQATATSTSGGGGAAAALSIGQNLFTQLRSAKAVGRLVINLSAAMSAAPGSSGDVILRDDDELIVPRFQQEVTVIGEVQTSTSHLFRPGLSRDDYIALSGGMTRRADRGGIYVVHANGSVVANAGNRWFERSNVVIKPGDTIVVPVDAERMPSLPYWQAITQILYNVAIAVAAVHAL
jgi:polysaccharide biosynthesis/export protein